MGSIQLQHWTQMLMNTIYPIYPFLYYENNAIEKPKVLKCTLKVLENRSTFEMYLSTSTSTEDFPEMYLSTFQVLYKLYLSTDVLKYKVLLPGSVSNASCRLHPFFDYIDGERVSGKCRNYHGISCDQHGSSHQEDAS